MTVLEVRDLRKSFRKNFWQAPVKALKGLSFAINKGESVGFLGANGSGKTTTFKCLLGLLRKDSGQALFFGKTLTNPAFRRIGFLPERPSFYENLTAFECLQFYGSLSGVSPLSLKPRLQEDLKSLGLYSQRHNKLKSFSKGMLQKIGLLQALIHDPQLVILDEPFSGLDPESRFAVTKLLERALKKGCALFVSSHIFQDVERLCNRFLIIKEGSVVFDGGFHDLQKLSPAGGHLLYLLKGQKRSLNFASMEEASDKLKSLLNEGAIPLSLQSEGGLLEQQYKSLMKKAEGQSKT